MHNRIILASASPQRKTLLERLGIQFETIPSDVDESVCPEQEPELRAKALAALKAESIARKYPDAYVIGSDTLVVASDGTLLEKPINAEDARFMLQRQSNTASVVHSAVAVFGPDEKSAQGISSSTVRFKFLTDKDLDWWITTEEWKGRSGSFQIDGHGQLMIERIEGDWTGIVGLPLFLLETLFLELGTSLRL